MEAPETATLADGDPKPTDKDCPFSLCTAGGTAASPGGPGGSAEGLT